METYKFDYERNQEYDDFMDVSSSEESDNFDDIEDVGVFTFKIFYLNIC